MTTCAGCGAGLELGTSVGRRDACPGCGADLHCCRTCAFHDVQAANECREPDAERVLDKTRSNFCDFWAPGSAVAAASASPAPRDVLERLFRRR